jgi:hypothetical protein
MMSQERTKVHLKAGSDEFASKKLEIAPEIAERSLGK